VADETPVPAQAVTLAAEVLHRYECCREDCGPGEKDFFRARRMLAAAVPVIRAGERERLRAELAGDQTADHAPIESVYGLTCRTCVAWQDDEGAHEFGIAIPEQWPCRVARALEGGNG
jgi:hypothetical protein